MPPGNSISDPIFNTLICLLLSLTLYFSFLLWEALQKKEATLIQLFLCFNGFFILFFLFVDQINFYSLKCIHRNTEIFIFQKSGFILLFLLSCLLYFFFNSADAFNIILGWFHNSINFSTLPYFFLFAWNLKKLCVVFSVFWFRRNVYDSGFNW